MSRIIDLLSSKKTVILDGAMGTELQRRGADTSLPLWSARALIDCPATVYGIHKDYLAAGAQIITTNTFRTNLRVLERAGCSRTAQELTLLACDLARHAQNDFGAASALVAGSIAPVEDCYEPKLVPPDRELEIEHRALTESLAEGGVDFIFCETFNCLREAKAVLSAAALTGIDTAISFVCNPEGDLLSGEHLEAAVLMSQDLGAAFVCVNCASPAVLEPALHRLASCSSIPFGIYANGSGVPDGAAGWTFDKDSVLDDDARIKRISPEDDYAEAALRWAKLGATVIGGCCGTTPDYIARLSKLLHN